MDALPVAEPIAAPPGVQLTDFCVRGFRAFEELPIRQLGRVNLFVGKNNVGKTSLLEALHFYAAGATPAALVELLTRREEVSTSGVRWRGMDPEARSAIIGRIFNAPANGEQLGEMVLGPSAERERQLSVRRGWIDVQHNDDGASQTVFSSTAFETPLGEEYPALQVRLGDVHRRFIRESNLFTYSRSADSESRILPSTYVPAFGLEAAEIGVRWSKVALTDLEELVRDALRIIAPDVERLSLLGDPDGSREQKMVVRLTGRAAPVPLRSLGDGMGRLLNISLSLVNAQRGLLLLDEVENGIHYSVQSDMWTMILNAAEPSTFKCSPPRTAGIVSAPLRSRRQVPRVYMGCFTAWNASAMVQSAT
jgi:hypothetical protein